MLGSQVIDHIHFHRPQHAWELVLTIGIVVWLAIRTWSLEGAPFAAIATLLAAVAFVLLEPHPYIPAALLLAALATRRSTRPTRCTGGVRSAALLLGECAILGGGFILYEIGRIHTVGSYDTAVRNAKRIMSFQERLGLPSETILQDLALRSELVVTLFNRTYSFALLSTTIGVLFWLYLNDRRRYRQFQAGLASACILTIAIVSVFPVAPPRLVPESGLISTKELMGGTHAFLNPYAAIPSNHVGWMVLAGVVLAISVGGRKGLILGLIPGLVMGVTVIVTGNHYWVDGIVGSAFSLLPVAAVTVWSCYRWHVPRTDWVVAGVRAHWASLTLAGLLSWLLIGRLVTPDLTEFWGYQVAQVGVTTLVIAAGEGWRRRGAIFTWETRAIVVATTYADTMGTAGHMYDRFPVYDKITHFAGTAAAAAICYEIVDLLWRQGRIGPGWPSPAVAALAFGVICGIGWEIYEYLADEVFHTGRSQGWSDTLNDLISDTAGAIIAIAVLERRSTVNQNRQPQPAVPPTAEGSTLPHPPLIGED